MCGCQDKEPAHTYSTQHVIFSGVTLRKTCAMWTPKWGAKSGPRFGVRRIVFSFRGPQCQDMCGCDKEPAHTYSTQHVIFSGVTLRKTCAMWTPKWGAKSGPRFGVRRIVFSFRGPHGVQILGPILRSTFFFFAA